MKESLNIPQSMVGDFAAAVTRLLLSVNHKSIN